MGNTNLRTTEAQHEKDYHDTIQEKKPPAKRDQKESNIQNHQREEKNPGKTQRKKSIPD